MLFSKKSVQEPIKAKALVGLLTLLSTQILVFPALSASVFAPTSINRQIPTGYTKSNYKISCSQTPSSKDLSVQDAAEIIAQEAYRFTKRDLNNQIINLKYNTFSNKSNTWLGTITLNAQQNKQIIEVCINASTGELFTISQHTFPLKSAAKSTSDTQACTSLSTLTNDFKKNQTTNCAKAKKLITDSGYLPEDIVTCKYDYSFISDDSETSISYGNHMFNLTTVSGKSYSFCLSSDLTQIYEVFTPEVLAR